MRTPRRTLSASPTVINTRGAVPSIRLRGDKSMKRHSSIPAILGAVLGVMLGMLALTSAAALAAAPEAPETLKPESVGASGALLRGILNPAKEGAPGTFEIDTYEFLYKASATECKGGVKSPAGMSLGGGME